MKTHSSIQTFHFVFMIWLVLVGVFLAPMAEAAVNFEVVKSLGKQNGKPTGALIQDAAGNFYGNTQFGGSHGAGTVYKIDASGNYSVLHEFDGDAGGKSPVGRLLLGSDGNLYGATSEGGIGGGTVFKLSLSGTFSVLHAFDGEIGFLPLSGLIQGTDGNFYGTTCNGGSQSYGTVYKLDSSGNGTVLHNFGESGSRYFCESLFWASEPKQAAKTERDRSCLRRPSRLSIDPLEGLLSFHTQQGV